MLTALTATTTGQCSVCTLLCPACQCSMLRVFEAVNVRLQLFEYVLQTVTNTRIWSFSQGDYFFVLYDYIQNPKLHTYMKGLFCACKLSIITCLDTCSFRSLLFHHNSYYPNYKNSLCLETERHVTILHYRGQEDFFFWIQVFICNI